MKNPKISIIIPVYNVEDYIEQCLVSVAKQTYKGAIECVIVDDRGNDSSVDIAQKFIRNYVGPISFSLKTRENNGGLSAARNTGIKQATGDYLYFLDSDDEITPNCIEDLVKPLLRYDYDVVVGRFYSEDKSEQSAIRYYKGNSEYYGKDVVLSYIDSKWYIMAWNKLFRKDYLVREQLFFCEGLIHEDVLWSFQIATTASSIYLADEITYFYRIRANSIMSTASVERLIEHMIRIMSNMCSFTYKRGLALDPDINFCIQKWFVSAIHYSYRFGGISGISNIYRKFRAIADSYNISPILYNRLCLNQKIIYAHWFMPVPLGERFMRLLHVFYKK